MDFPAPSTRGKISEKKGLGATLGSRVLEKVQLTRPSEHPEIQNKVAILLNAGYIFAGTAQEKASKEYISMDDPAQATDRLGQNNGELVTTFYFIQGSKGKKK